VLLQHREQREVADAMEVQWRGIGGLGKQVLDAVREQGVERAVPCRADLGVGLFRRCVQTLVAVDGSVFRVTAPCSV
jgi:hypothetical protein